MESIDLYKLSELKEMAKRRDIKGRTKMNKIELYIAVRSYGIIVKLTKPSNNLKKIVAKTVKKELKKGKEKNTKRMKERKNEKNEKFKISKKDIDHVLIKIAGWYSRTCPSALTNVEGIIYQIALDKKNEWCKNNERKFTKIIDYLQSKYFSFVNEYIRKKK